jgi:hypothetical protein
MSRASSTSRGKPTGSNAKPGTRSCGRAALRCPRSASRRAEPTIGKAINGGYDLLEAKCNRCDRVSRVALRSLKHPAKTPVWKLEAALYCEPCSEGRHYSRRQRAHILGLTYDRPDPVQPRMPARKASRKP